MGFFIRLLNWNACESGERLNGINRPQRNETFFAYRHMLETVWPIRLTANKSTPTVHECQSPACTKMRHVRQPHATARQRVAATDSTTSATANHRIRHLNEFYLYFFKIIAPSSISAHFRKLATVHSNCRWANTEAPRRRSTSYHWHTTVVRVC